MDISDRSALDELRTAETLRAAILESSMDGIITIDPTGVVVEWNPAATAIFGFTREEAVGHEMASLIIPPEFRDRHRAGIAHYLETGEGAVLRRRIELPALRADGARILIELFITPIRTANLLRFTGFVRDVTASKRQADELAQAIADEQAARAEAEAARRQTAFLAEAGLVLASSLDSDQTFAQLAKLAVPRFGDWCSITMRAPDGGLRTVAVAHVDPAKVAYAYELQKKFPPEPDAPTGVPAVLRTGKSEFYPEIPQALIEALPAEQRDIIKELGLVSAMTIPIKLRGEPIGAISFVTAESGKHYGPADVTLAEELARRAGIAIENARLYQEARTAESELRVLAGQLEQRVAERTGQLEAANKELEAFAYSVSHDLRAPLRAIDGFGMALEEDYGAQLDATGKDYLQRVRAASQRMAQLIEDLLGFSRLTRGAMARQPVDLTAIAREVAATIQQTQPERKVDWAIQEGLTAEGDPRLLRVVFDNLLGNAWKFTGHHPTARIEVSSAERDGKTVFCVRDDGAGFDQAFAEKLFTPFQRLHAVTEFPGTGIGLATVQRVVHRHGGRIWAEAAPELGATFCFTLGQA